MKARIFLTGISGYLGSVLVEHLARLPEVELITGIALTAPAKALPAKAKFIRMDVRSPDVVGLMAGHDVVIHTAAVVLWPAAMPTAERDDINLNGVKNVAQAAVFNQVRRFVHASSIAAYDPHLARGKSGIEETFPTGKQDAFFYYWSAKAVAEKILTSLFENTTTVLTLLRPIYIIGPCNRKIIKCYRENAVNFPGHDPRRQFIHEDDVAAAFALAVTKDMPGAYNVVPDDFMRMSEVWKAVGARFIPTIPLWLARAVAAFRWRYLRSAFHPSWVADMLVDVTASNAKLRSAGWQPGYGSAEALRATL